jgi:hypothetical protein
LRGLVFHGLGEHRKAIQELSIGLSIENTIECLYLRGSCYHAVGEYRDAVNICLLTLWLHSFKGDSLITCLEYAHR